MINIENTFHHEIEYFDRWSKLVKFDVLPNSVQRILRIKFGLILSKICQTRQNNFAKMPVEVVQRCVAQVAAAHARSRLDLIREKRSRGQRV